MQQVSQRLPLEPQSTILEPIVMGRRRLLITNEKENVRDACLHGGDRTTMFRHVLLLQLGSHLHM